MRAPTPTAGGSVTAPPVRVPARASASGDRLTVQRSRRLHRDGGVATHRKRLIGVLAFVAGLFCALVLGTSGSAASIEGQIAFTRIVGSQAADIYAMKVDGTNQTNLTDHPADDGSPSWSPDGSKIAFYTRRDAFDAEIYVMDADGGNPINVTNHPGDDFTPAWSPDGEKIAFTSFRDGQGEIYVMDADGGNPINLTNHPGDDVDPSWSPDGAKIAFTSTRGEDVLPDIYVMNADGSDQINLTNSPGVTD